MDYFEGIREVALLLFLGTLVFGMLFSALGWLLRGRSNRSLGVSDNNNDLTAPNNRSVQELLLAQRSTQYKLETKEAELREFRARSTEELRAAQERIEKLRQYKDSLRQSQAQINKLAADNTQIRKDLTQANETLDATTALTIDVEASSERYQALQRDYSELAKVKDTETKKLRAEMEDLRTSNVTLLGKLEESQRTTAEQQSDSQDFAQRLSESEAQLITFRDKFKAEQDSKSALQKKLADLEEKTQRENDSYRNKAADSDTLKQELEALQQTHAVLKKEKENLQEELSSARKKADSSISDTKEHEKHLNDIREDSLREINSLKKKLEDNRKLEVVNKNQSNTIARLEEKLQDVRNNSGAQESAKAGQIKTLAELETAQLKLSDKERQLESNIREMDNLRHELKKSEFETKKLSGLQRQLRQADEKNHELRQQLVDLETLKNEREANTRHIEQLMQQIKAQETATAESNAADSEQLKDLNSELDARATTITNLERENITLKGNEEQLSSRIMHLEGKSAGLIAEVERAKSHRETADKFESRIKKLDASLTDMQEENRTLKDNVATLETALETSRSEADEKTQNKLNALFEKNKQQSDIIVELEEAKDKDAQESLRAEARLHTQAKAIDEAKEQFDTLDTKYKALYEKNLKQSDVIVELEESLQSIKQTHTDQLHEKLRAQASRQEERMQSANEEHNTKISKLEKTHQQSSEQFLQQIATLNDANKDKDSLIAKLESTKQEAGELGEKYQKLFEKNKKQSDLIVELEEKQLQNKNELAAALKNHQQEKDKQQQQNKQLEQQNKQQIDQLEQQKNQNRELGQRLNQSQEEQNKLQESVNSLEQKLLDVANKQTEESTRQLEKSKAGLAELQLKLNQSQEERNKLQESVNTFEQKLSDATDKQREESSRLVVKSKTDVAAIEKKLQSANTELKAATQKLESERKLALEKHTEIQEKYIDVNNKHTTAQEQYTQVLGTLKKRDQKLILLEEEAAELRAELKKRSSDAEAANLKLREDLAQRDKEFAEHNKLLAEGSKELSAKTDELATHKKNIDSIRKQLESTQTKLASIESTNSSSESRQKELHDSIGVLKATVAEKDSALESLSTDMLTSSGKIKSLEKQIEDKNRSLESMVQKTEKLELELQQDRELLKDQEKLKKDASQTQELRKSVIEKDHQLTLLKREQEKFNALQALINERQADVDRLQSQINRLSDLEKTLIERDREIKKLKNDAGKLKARDQKISELEHKLSLARQQQAQHLQAQQEPVEENIGNNLELKRLTSQVQSLTNERNLGLERVRELSQIAKTVDEKDKTIKELKSSITDNRISDREVEALRSKTLKQESDIRNKNATIESLRRQMQAAGLSQTSESSNLEKIDDADDDGVVVAEPKTRTETRPATTQASTKTSSAKPAVKKAAADVTSSPKPLYKAPAEKDDLKLIKGIGPKMEKMLYSLGITSFQQIAEFKSDDIERVSEALDAFPGRIERDDWVGGAKKHYLEKYKTRT